MAWMFRMLTGPTSEETIIFLLLLLVLHNERPKSFVIKGLNRSKEAVVCSSPSPCGEQCILLVQAKSQSPGFNHFRKM